MSQPLVRVAKYEGSLLAPGVSRYSFPPNSSTISLIFSFKTNIDDDKLFISLRSALVRSCLDIACKASSSSLKLPFNQCSKKTLN